MSNTFASLIRKEFSIRQRRNPGYSLRAFSKFLGVNPSTLSRVISGKQKISEMVLLRIGVKLGLKNSDIEKYKRSAINKKRKTPLIRLDTETFLKVTDLYHYAVMNLLSIKTFRPDPGWMAEQLNIPADKAKDAWDRLQQIGLIKKLDDGRWVRTYADTTNIPEEKVKITAYRDIQVQILNHAVKSLYEEDGSRRDNSALTIAVDSKLIPEAMQRITKFRRELAAFLTSGENDQVYSVAIALFPLTAER